MLASDIGALAHGWSGLAIAFASVQAPMLVGMLRARAAFHRLLLSPLMAAPATVLAGIGMTLASPTLRGFGVAHSGLWHLAAGTALCAGIGYVTGRSIGGDRRAGSAPVHQRGALVARAEGRAGTEAADIAATKLSDR